MEPSTAKTVGLLQRGLRQVADTVGALLVEARVTSRPLTRHDLEDVHTLIEPQAGEKEIVLDWRVDLPPSMDLPAGFVRQILINLLLNAIQATATGGRVQLVAAQVGAVVELIVANSGDPLPDAVRAHLFEPFASAREGGHGLGLWVTYQTVTQLGGQIVADSAGSEVRFTVTLPLGQGRA
jgi:signal transduction histidine kinase